PPPPPRRRSPSRAPPAPRRWGSRCGSPPRRGTSARQRRRGAGGRARRRPSCRLPAPDVEDRRPPVLQRPLAGVGEALKLVLVDEVRVLALAAARNARVPRERGPGRDRRGEPAALDLRRHHLELALLVADR